MSYPNKRKGSPLDHDSKRSKNSKFEDNKHFKGSCSTSTSVNKITDKVNKKLKTENLVDPLGEMYSKQIRPFIDVIDNLRKYGLQKDIDLPRVVVLGDQSSGKSSIIEAISGIELPRGKGIVTRCPLELQLSRVPKKAWSGTLSYKDVNGESIERKTEIPEDVGNLIKEAQESMCDTKKGVSSELITLRIESPAASAPDLTLIDLPGIARTAVLDQPKDICNQIKQILKTFIKEENTVILCVISANLDLGVNESISMAKEFDPDGVRTFGVLTKPDTVIEESSKNEVLAVLNNERIHLTKNYHMIKCRSQTELENKMTLAASLEREKEFFANDDHYKTADEHKLGTTNLAMKITEELVENIKMTLPKLMETIEMKMILTEKELKNLPEAVPQTKEERSFYLVKTIYSINQIIQEVFDTGKSPLSKENHFSKWRVMFEGFKSKIDSKYNCSLLNQFSKEKLENELKLNRGCEIMGFLNFDLFQKLIKSHIELYEIDAEELLDKMVKDTKTIIVDLLNENFLNLKLILSKLKKLVEDDLTMHTNKAKDRLKLVFEEESLIFTMDSIFNKELDFFNKCDFQKHQNEKQAPTEIFPTSVGPFGTTIPKTIFKAPTSINMLITGDSEEQKFVEKKRNGNYKKNVEKLRTIIQCYLTITNGRLSDCIPMAIRHILHVQLVESLKTKFMTYSLESNSTEDLTEDTNTLHKRQEKESKLKRLKLAKEELMTFV